MRRRRRTAPVPRHRTSSAARPASLRAQPRPLGLQHVRAPPPGSARRPGRSNSRSSTACTSVPRAVAGGRRLGDAVDHPEPVQQRAGHEVRRARRRQRRRRVARRSPGSAATSTGSASRTAFIDVHTATVGQRADISQPSRPRRTAENAPRRPRCETAPRAARARGDARCRRMHVASVVWQVARRSSRTGAASGSDRRTAQGPVRSGRWPGSRAGIIVARPFGIPVLRVAVLVHHRRRLHRHLRQRPEHLAERQHQVRGRRRLRGAALRLRARARAVPTRSWRAASACRCAASCSTRSAASPRSSGRRRPPAASSPWPAAGPALSLVLGALGWGLVPGRAVRRDRRADQAADGAPTSSWASSTCCPACRSTAAGCCAPSSGRSPGKPNTATIAAAWVGRVLALALLLAIPFFSGRPGRRRHGEHAVGGGHRRVHVDRRQPVDQGHQVPRAAARAAGAPPGAQGHLGPREHPARRGDQAGGRGQRPRRRRRRPRQQADRDRQRGRRHGHAAAAQAVGGRGLAWPGRSSRA